jgi:hypothetical protein
MVGMKSSIPGLKQECSDTEIREMTDPQKEGTPAGKPVESYTSANALEDAKYIYDQLMIMTKIALIFNGSLAAASGFVLNMITTTMNSSYVTTFDPCFIIAATCVSIVAVIFNVGALIAHNNIWRVLSGIKDKIQSSDEEFIKDAILRRILNSIDSSARLGTTKSFTQFFYSALISSWFFAAVYSGYMSKECYVPFTLLNIFNEFPAVFVPIIGFLVMGIIFSIIFAKNGTEKETEN